MPTNPYLQVCQDWACRIERGENPFCSSCLEEVTEESNRCDTCLCCMDCCECWYCESCGNNRESNTNQCSECEYCPDCCECIFCASCNHIINDNRQLCECGSSYCTSCCEDCNNLHYFACSIEPTFHYSKKPAEFKVNPLSRIVAAEIEVENIKNGENYANLCKIVRKWGGAIVSDSSLSACGIEINTAPSNGDQFVTQIQDICKYVKAAGGKIEDNCGLHVHADARDFTYYDTRRLIILYAAVESTLYDLLPWKRANSRYCVPCGYTLRGPVRASKIPSEYKKSLAYLFYLSENTKGKRNHKYNVNRYHAMNLHSWFFRKTVENRMFIGTIDPQKIVWWATLWGSILDFALKNSEKEINDIVESTKPLEILKGLAITEEQREFIEWRYRRYGEHRKTTHTDNLQEENYKTLVPFEKYFHSEECFQH